jgi:hypothetical protein
LKKSATTENVTNYILNSDSSDPPSTIIKSCQKRFREFGSDERKIISGFLSTPLLIIKTPGNTFKDLPRSPLQKITKKSNLGLFSEGSSFLVKETSSIESIKFNETLLIEETIKETSEINQIITSSNNNNSSNIVIPNTSLTSISTCSISQTILNSRKEREHESFQASNKARILEERERIETQAAIQARKIQKLKAGPTSLPVKSTKPLTIPKGFQLGCDERAQLKKLQSKSQTTKQPLTTTAVPKVIKPTISQKFTPTIPKSPLFASKLRAEAKAEKEKEKSRNKDKENSVARNTTDNSNIINTASTMTALELRKKLEYRPMLSSINKTQNQNQNRMLNHNHNISNPAIKKNINSGDNNKN